MVVELLVEAFMAVVQTLLSGLALLIPPVPGFVVTATGHAGTVMSWVQGFETWIPVNFALGCVAAVGVTYLAGLLIGLARVVVSYVTLGGGAT